MNLITALLVLSGSLALVHSSEEGKCMSLMRELIGAGGTQCPPGCSSRIKMLEQEISNLKNDFYRIIRKTDGACYVRATSASNPDYRPEASSSHNDCLLPHVYLHSSRSWCAANKNPGSWVGVDLGTPKKITGVVTQGRQNYGQWVKTYTVRYGNSPALLQSVLENGRVKVFQANTEQFSLVRNFFPSPVIARYVRIYPVSYHGHPSMRFDLLDC